MANMRSAHSHICNCNSLRNFMQIFAQTYCEESHGFVWLSGLWSYLQFICLIVICGRNQRNELRNKSLGISCARVCSKSGPEGGEKEVDREGVKN